MKMKTKKKGFTLIELLVCLFIIGLMMLLLIPNIAHQREEAKKKSIPVCRCHTSSAAALENILKQYCA